MKKETVESQAASPQQSLAAAGFRLLWATQNSTLPQGRAERQNTPGLLQRLNRSKTHSRRSQIRRGARFQPVFPRTDKLPPGTVRHGASMRENPGPRFGI